MTSSKHQDINVYRLLGRGGYFRTYTGVESRESIFWRDSAFWREKVDFVKTPGFKCLPTFWREKKFALIQGSNHESRFFGGIRLFGGIKSTSSKHRDINVYRHFGEKKYVCIHTGVQTRDSIFWRDSTFGGKKSTSSKHRDTNAYRLFSGKKYVCTSTGVQLQVSIFWRETPGEKFLSTFWREKIPWH